MMKPFLTLFTLLVLISFAAISQSEHIKETKFGFGIKAGLYDGNTLVINSSNGATQTGLPSYSAGIFGDVKLKNHFAIQAELNYTRLSFNGTYQYGFNPDYTETLKYIELPVLGKYTLQNTGLSFVGGLNFAYLQSAKTKASGYPELDDMDYYKKFSLGPILGGDYHFKNGIELSLRKTLGFLNIAKNRSDKTIELPSGTYITVGFRFK